jgi:hypothetical protein
MIRDRHTNAGPDHKFRRRSWLAIATFATAVSVCLYFPLIGALHLTLMTALILFGGLVTLLVSAACGGLIVKTLPMLAQSKAAAWIMAGQLGGGAVGAAVILWLAVRMPIATVGLCVAGLIALPGLLPFTIPESLPEPSPMVQRSSCADWQGDLGRRPFTPAQMGHAAPPRAGWIRSRAEFAARNCVALWRGGNRCYVDEWHRRRGDACGGSTMWCPDSGNETAKGHS